jgi:hypothetical protein
MRKKRVSALQQFLILEETATVKQYQGTTSHERDPHDATSGQPAAPPAQKTVPNRKTDAQKKIKTGKQGEPRER